MIFRHYPQSPLALYTVIIAIHFLQITSFQSFYYPKTIMPSVPKCLHILPSVCAQASKQPQVLYAQAYIP